MKVESYTLGLDLGGTSVKAVALDGDVLVGQDHEPFILTEPMAFAGAMERVVVRFTERLGRPLSIGVSAPGIPALDDRSIAHMPGRFEGLEGLVWGDRLGRSEGVPVVNDANAALLGEVGFGSGRGARHAVLLTLGTGVGGAVLSDGRLLRGHTGKAGHLGHVSLDPEADPDICNTPGSLEDAMGNHNIGSRTAGRFATTHDLVQAVESGDEEARGIWLRSVRALAAAIASFGNVLDPEVVIVGGGVARAGETLFGPLRTLLADMEWRPGGKGLRLVPAELGELAGAHGAALWGRRGFPPPGSSNGPL